MSKSIFSSKRTEAFQLLCIPASVITLGAGLTYTMHAQAVSALLVGSWIWLVPNYYFAAKVFAERVKLTPPQLLQNFYLAEIIKLVLYAILFGLVLKFSTLSIPLLLLGYGLAQLLFLMAPFFLSRVKRLVKQ